MEDRLHESQLLLKNQVAAEKVGVK